jgi:hypothetical protein
MPYDNYISTHEFLYVFYLKLGNKITHIIELMDENQPFKNNNEIFETKDKLLSALDLLIRETQDEELISELNKFAELIVSTDKKDLLRAVEICENIRK